MNGPVSVGTGPFCTPGALRSGRTSRLLPGSHETWADADAAFASFVASFPERRAQLRDRLVDTGGPELDGSIESLDALNEWYIRVAFEDQHDGRDWWPEWQDPAEGSPRSRRGHA